MRFYIDKLPQANSYVHHHQCWWTTRVPTIYEYETGTCSPVLFGNHALYVSHLHNARWMTWGQINTHT